jgi:hypothetical protein
MNQRREARLAANESVAITLFGEPDITIPARVKNISARGIGLELEGPVAPGTAVKIELQDALLLGEVIYCRRNEASYGVSYYLGVELDQALSGLAELSRVVNAFGEPARSGPQQAHAVVERSDERQQQAH